MKEKKSQGTSQDNVVDRKEEACVPMLVFTPNQCFVRPKVVLVDDPAATDILADVFFKYLRAKQICSTEDKINQLSMFKTFLTYSMFTSIFTFDGR